MCNTILLSSKCNLKSINAKNSKNQACITYLFSWTYLTINSWTCLGPWEGHTSNISFARVSDWIIIFNCNGSTNVFGWWIILFWLHKFKISCKLATLSVPWNLEIQCNNPILDLIFFFQVTMSNHDPQIVQNCTSDLKLCWRKRFPDWQSFLIFFLYLVIPRWAHRVSFQRDLKFEKKFWNETFIC